MCMQMLATCRWCVMAVVSSWQGHRCRSLFSFRRASTDGPKAQPSAGQVSLRCLVPESSDFRGSRRLLRRCYWPLRGSLKAPFQTVCSPDSWWSVEVGEEDQLAH